MDTPAEVAKLADSLSQDEVGNLIKFECTSDDNSADVRSRIGTLPLDQAAVWLNDAQNVARCRSVGILTGHIKLVLIDLGAGREIEGGYRHQVNRLAKLLKSQQFPSDVHNSEDLVHSYFFPRDWSFTSEPPVLNQDVSKGCIVSQNAGIAWKHCQGTHLTVGIAWYHDPENRTEIASVLYQLVCYRSLTFHPLLIAILELRALHTTMRGWVQGESQQVLQAQVDSGFHQFASLETGVVQSDINLGSLSASVSGIAANLATSEQCLRGLLTLAEMIREETVKLYVNEIPDEKQCSHLLQVATSSRRKATIVVQGCFNLIAQRDQTANLAIAEDSRRLAAQSANIARESRILAEESKKDSTSMKAIAAVTMFFLPGTFIASFLDIPMFAIDAQSGQLVHHQLWLYWAITVPLTLLTVVIWLIWNHFSIARQTSQHPFYHEAEQPALPVSIHNQNTRRIKR